MREEMPGNSHERQSLLSNQNGISNHHKPSEDTLRHRFRGCEAFKPFNRAPGIPPSIGPSRLFSSLRAPWPQRAQVRT